MQKRPSNSAPPKLPSIVSKPLAWIPSPLKLRAITNAMNAVFAVPLQAGELGFLAERVINIRVSDAALNFSLRIDQGKLRADIEVLQADLTIEGAVHTFLLLAARKEDADTLFFQRQLKTSGDTELGLHVKYFLDGIEPETQPYHRTIDRILRGSLAVADGAKKIRSRLLNRQAP